MKTLRSTLVARTSFMECTAVIKKSEGWWIGWIEEVPGVFAQATTREELMDNLQEALADMIDYYRSKALSEAGEDYEESKVAV